MKRITCVLAASSVLAATSAHAQSPAQPSAPPPAPQPLESTVHRHMGFALRLDGGIGYTGTSTTISNADRSVKGVSGSFGLVIGLAVAENLILGADFWGTLAISPTFSPAGSPFTGIDAALALSGFGLNLTYYFMPANVYVSLSPSLTTVSITQGGASAEMEKGFGMKIAVGKEWWVSDHWGLGLAGQFFFSSNDDQGTNPSAWSTLAGGLAFSATYN